MAVTNQVNFKQNDKYNICDCDKPEYLFVSILVFGHFLNVQIIITSPRIMVTTPNSL